MNYNCFLKSTSHLKDNLVFISENNWLWPNLPHLWARTNNPTELFLYLDQAISASPQPTARSPMHSAMAQTTPSVLDILLLRGSLRINADGVNRRVTARLTSLWRPNANIVSTDFFLGNDVIDVSIAISVERAEQLWRHRARNKTGGLHLNNKVHITVPVLPPRAP